MATTKRMLMRSAAAAWLAAVPGIASGAPQCQPGPETLCLGGARFEVEVGWTDFQGRTGRGQAKPLTADTGYFWFFDPANVELVIKVLDGRPLNGSFWVFYGALSNVEYEIAVRDTETGEVRHYRNPARRFASVGDTQAFPAGASAGDTAASPTVFAVRPSGATAVAGVRPPAAAGNAGEPSCMADALTLCLNGGRFRLEVEWEDFQGRTGSGQARALTGDTGYFWFFDPDNVEIVVKVLDGRPLNEHFWVFYGALSNVEFQIRVLDTVSGLSRTYSNPLGEFASTGDTQAFRPGLAVEVELDEERAATAIVPVEGGEIQAVAADGTAFILTVPPGALLSDEEITLTPVAHIPGLPSSGGLSAAVHLAPEGLRLLEAGILAIEPAAAIPPEEETPFAFRAKGGELILYPPLPRAGRLELPIFHFSGYGVARASAADRAAQLARTPGGAEDRYLQRLATFAGQGRRQAADRALSEGAARAIAASSSTPLTARDWWDDLEREHRRYWDQEIAPHLSRARQDCDFAPSFFPKALGFARSVAILCCRPGVSFEAETHAIFEALVDAVVHCYDEAFRKCVDNNDPRQGIEMLRLLRTAELVGGAERLDNDKLHRCLTFELEFDTFLRTDSGCLDMDQEGRARVPIPAEFVGFATESAPLEAPLEYSFRPSVCQCSVTGVSTTPGTFRVFDLQLPLNHVEGGPPLDAARIRLAYFPGDPAASFSMTCSGGVTQNAPAAQWFPSTYFAVRLLTTGWEQLGGLVATDWTAGSGALLARKTYQGAVTLEGTTFSDTTIMNLWHRPR